MLFPTFGRAVQCVPQREVPVLSSKEFQLRSDKNVIFSLVSEKKGYLSSVFSVLEDSLDYLKHRSDSCKGKNTRQKGNNNVRE